MGFFWFFVVIGNFLMDFGDYLGSWFFLVVLSGT